MQPLEGDEEEVKEGTGLKIFTRNKLLARLSNIIKTNKSWKQFIQIKNEIRPILHLLYQHNKFTNKVYNNLMKSL